MKIIIDILRYIKNKFDRMMVWLEILLVRLISIIVTIYLCIVLYNAYNGISASYGKHICGHALLYDLLLFVLAYNAKKYHCKYLLMLIINLIFIDVLGVCNEKWGLVEDYTTYIYIISYTSILSAIVTIYYAIKHFYNINKSKWQQTK